MKDRLHLVALALFLLAFLYDCVLWGAVSALPDIGRGIVASAKQEAPLASTYIVLGELLDASVPGLHAFGEQRVARAFVEGFASLDNDTDAAMDTIFHESWNATHRWLRIMYWVPVPLLLAFLVLWWRRPRRVRSMGRR